MDSPQRPQEQPNCGGNVKGSAAVSAGVLLEQELAASDANAIDAAIEPRFARALRAEVFRTKPKLAIEIGMANGISTLAILSGLPSGAQLISIDPFQDTQWKSAGRELIARSDRACDHSVRTEPDYLALPALIREGVTVDFAYIDGMHTFDYVSLDAFFVDKLLRVGGVVAFNDCGFRSIHKFLKLFRSHRRYEEIDVGLTPDYRGRNPLISAARRMSGRSNQDRYFRKFEQWEPPHNFFRQF
jgi:predicted O-methyltransferase YrrM